MSEHRASPSVNGWNGAYVDDLYGRWKENPEAVAPEWRSFFEGFDLGATRPPAPTAAGRRAAPAIDGNVARAHEVQWRIDTLIYHYRDLGHLAADLDPLGTKRPRPAKLSLEAFGLSEAQLDQTFDPGLLPLPSPAPLRDIVQLLEDTYCRTVGVEYMHIQDTDRRRWLQERMEQVRNRPAPSQQQQLRLLDRLIEADGFESFLRTRYVGKKRFGLEGGESLIPMLDTIVEGAPGVGVGEIVMGMAHRGRLNVLVNVLKKSFDQIFTEFEELWQEDFIEGGGDVKYHPATRSTRKTADGGTVKLALAPNPSHLEFVDGIVLGRTRAKQRLADDASRKRVLPLLIHGDAAFAGQGIVAECFNMMRLDGYTVGGTLHVDHQQPDRLHHLPARLLQRRYCTDVAKMVECPIFHVNGDDPEACAWVAKIALDYRQAFGDDVVIDFWCYRRHGHNEADEPAFTQPLMYQRIKAQQPTLARYRDHLVEQGVITPEQFESTSKRLVAAMDEAQNRSKEKPVDPSIDPFGLLWQGLAEDWSWDHVETAVDRERLETVAEALGHAPGHLKLHRTISKVLEHRRSAAGGDLDATLDWATGEQLAFGTLLLDGIPVRLTGQDVERGTFSHRHSVVRCQETGEEHVPLNSIAPGAGEVLRPQQPAHRARVPGLRVRLQPDRSPHAHRVGGAVRRLRERAQVIIDQFIASAELKWQRHSGLVLSLPHGYEGQGPEHSSARLERFLQLCAGGNMQVVCARPRRRRSSTSPAADAAAIPQAAHHHDAPRACCGFLPRRLRCGSSSRDASSRCSTIRASRIPRRCSACSSAAARSTTTARRRTAGAPRLGSGDRARRAAQSVPGRASAGDPRPLPERRAHDLGAGGTEEPGRLPLHAVRNGSISPVAGSSSRVATSASPAVGSTRIHAREQAKLIAEAVGVAPKNLALSEADAAGGVEDRKAGTAAAR